MFQATTFLLSISSVSKGRGAGDLFRWYATPRILKTFQELLDNFWNGKLKNTKEKADNPCSIVYNIIRSAI